MFSRRIYHIFGQMSSGKIKKNKVFSTVEPKIPSSGAVAMQKAFDEKYLKAVKKGDMETAQKTVDEAALGKKKRIPSLRRPLVKVPISSPI